MKAVTFKRYVAMRGYQPMAVYEKPDGYYARIKGWASNSNGFTSTRSGGTILHLSKKDAFNPRVVGNTAVVFENAGLSKIREIVRKMIGELQHDDDELEEMTGTAAVAGYMTPAAFKKTDGTDKSEEPDSAYVDRLNKSTGYSRVNENRWIELKKSEGTPSQKIGVGIRNINNQLSEMEQFINWYSKIKTESGMDSSEHWKRTKKHLSKIRERLNRISTSITNL